MKNLLMKIKSAIDGHEEELSNKVRGIKDTVDDQLTLIELGEKLGITVPSYHSAWDFWVELTSEKTLVKFYKGGGRTISCPDDDKQPEEGWYLRLGFPTGAYIFNQHYPTKSFEGFFEELKGYEPDHCDSVNHVLYFNLDVDPTNARLVYKDYDIIFKKWWDAAQEEVLESRIKEAEGALLKLREKKG